jgi:hypothetical protein
MLTEKIFQNVETHENVSIIGDNGAFYSLSNGANIKKDIFFQKFSERIDPNSFFNSGPTNNLLELSERIKSIDTNKIENIGGNMPSKVRQLQKSVSENIEVPDEYRKMLMKNKEWEENHKDLFEYKVYDNDEDSIQDFERKNTQKQQEPNRNVNRSRPVEQTNVSDYDDSDYVEQIEKAGLVFSGTSPKGVLMEIAELPKSKHPFFLGTQFHPEFKGRPISPHPLFTAFIKAAIGKK